MASKRRFDIDQDGEKDGIQGGEMTQPCDIGPTWDWQPPRGSEHMGDRLGSDDAHGYLGHFRKPSNARRGHNCVDM